MTETWRPVAGFDDAYEVSDHGRVRSVDRLIETRADRRKRAFVRLCRGRVLRPAANPHGYLHVNLHREKKQHTRDVHVLVLRAFVGLPPEGAQGCHNDGNPDNNHLSNLRWDSSSENHLDKVRHGTHHSAARKACPRGHLLVIPNLVASGLRQGTRACLACSRGKARIRNAKLGGKRAPGDMKTVSDLYYAELMKEAA